MQPGELNKAIASGNVPHLLCLYGEEAYFVRRALQRIEERVVDVATREFNYRLVYGKELDGAQLRDEARTLPVFSPRRLIVVRRIDEAPAAELERLQVYLGEAVPETVLVVTAEKIDARRKFYQEFKKHGQLVEFKRLYENRLPGFVRELAAEHGFDLTEDAMTRFCRRVGTDLQDVAAELEKLAAFLGERDLADVADVDAVVSCTRIESIFALNDAVGNRDSSVALRLLQSLLADGTAPLAALSMLARHFRQLWKAAELVRQGTPRNEMPRAIGVNPYFLDNLLAQAGHFGPDDFRRIFERLVETDLALKSSGSRPPVILERLLLGIIGAGSTQRGH